MNKPINADIVRELQSLPMHILIPQRPPFVMVDAVEDFSYESTATRFCVPPDNLFVENGCLNAAGLVENVAQTCAVRMGCINYINRESIKLGFIGAVRDMSFLRLPKVGEVLTTSIVVREEIFGMTLVDAEVRVGDELITTAEMKIAISETEAVES